MRQRGEKAQEIIGSSVVLHYEIKWGNGLNDCACLWQLCLSFWKAEVLLREWRALVSSLAWPDSVASLNTLLF